MMGRTVLAMSDQPPTSAAVARRRRSTACSADRDTCAVAGCARAVRALNRVQDWREEDHRGVVVAFDRPERHRLLGDGRWRTTPASRPRPTGASPRSMPSTSSTAAATSLPTGRDGYSFPVGDPRVGELGRAWRCARGGEARRRGRSSRPSPWGPGLCRLPDRDEVACVAYLSAAAAHVGVRPPSRSGRRADPATAAPVPLGQIFVFSRTHAPICAMAASTSGMRPAP